MNINNNEEAPVSNALDKLAGMIKEQVSNTGIITGKKPFLKSFITDCFLLKVLDMNINKASFAKSLDWKVKCIIGNLIHLLPSLIFVPQISV